MTRVLGIDGCRTGWAGIVWDGTRVNGVFAARLTDLLETAGAVDAVVLDMPIGLPDHGVRAADRLAKQELGPKASSIFLTSTRPALAAPTRAEADALNRAHGSGGVTAQAFALHAKIAEVDDAVRATGAAVVEGHPELSFAALAGAPVLAPKRSWAGSAVRRSLLAGAGIHRVEVRDGRARGQHRGGLAHGGNRYARQAVVPGVAAYIERALGPEAQGGAAVGERMFGGVVHTVGRRQPEAPEIHEVAGLDPRQRLRQLRTGGHGEHGERQQQACVPKGSPQWTPGHPDDGTTPGGAAPRCGGRRAIMAR